MRTQTFKNTVNGIVAVKAVKLDRGQFHKTADLIRKNVSLLLTTTRLVVIETNRSRFFEMQKFYLIGIDLHKIFSVFLFVSLKCK